MKLIGKMNDELQALRVQIESNPANQQTGSLFKYTPSARKKLDAIAWAITANLRAAKLARGEYINDAGYSGRQTNR